MATSGSLTARVMRKFVPALMMKTNKRNKGSSLAGILSPRPRNHALIKGTKSMAIPEKDQGQMVSYLGREEIGVGTARKVSMGGWEVR